jgi:hypothetical protein
MITLCVVSLDRLKRYLDILYNSIYEHTSLINEIVIVKVDEKPDFKQEWQTNGINFKLIGYQKNIFLPIQSNLYDKLLENENPAMVCLEHALALHQAIDHATNDLVMLCDPDVFFLSEVDKIYLDLFEKHNLNIIGISHHSAVCRAESFFPTVINSMFRKSSLPGEDYLREFLTSKNSLAINATEADKAQQQDVPLPGKILIPSNVTGLVDVWPNPNGYHETGCNLLLWAKEQNWNWLSFQTMDCRLYTTGYCRGNIKTPKLKKQNLMYHAMNSTRGHPYEIKARLVKHKEAWESLNKEEQ